MDVTATTANSDYVGASGTLTFYPGQVTKTILITINGDMAAESTETFNVVLSNPCDATITTATGVGTIIDDDNDGPAITSGPWANPNPTVLWP